MSFFFGAGSNLGNISLLFESIGLRSVPSTSTLSFFRSAKAKTVKGKKKKEKENEGIEAKTTKEATTTTTTTESPHLVEVNDKGVSTTCDEGIEVTATPEGVEEVDGSTTSESGDSGCGESGDRYSVEEKYEDHACQTDDFTQIDTSGRQNVRKSVEVNASDLHTESTKKEKQFEDLGVQTEPELNYEETFERPILNSSMNDEGISEGSLNNTADLNLIDSILEKNKETIESMKTNYIKEYLNKTTNINVQDFHEDTNILQSTPFTTDQGTETENTVRKSSMGKKEQLEEEIVVEEEVSLESVDWDVDRMSEGTSSYDEEQTTTNSSESDSDDVDNLRLRQLCGTQKSVESDQNEEVEHPHFKQNTMLEGQDEDEEEGDSGTELRYDELANKGTTTSTTTSTTPSDYDYSKYVEKIKPLLYDAELVANLFIRLANKYANNNKTNTNRKNTEKNAKNIDKIINNNNKNNSTIDINRISIADEKDILEEQIQHIHSAQIAYDVIKESRLTNFAHVVTHLLSYLGAIKSEKPIPENASIPNLLNFLSEMVHQNSMTSEHVTMFTCFLARPNRTLLPYHDLRTNFLLTCFKQELSQLNVHTDDRSYVRTCFIKLCEYFVQLDMEVAQELTREYLLPHLCDTNSTTFVMDVLTYMGLVKSEELVITTQDITSPLLLLDFVFVSKRMSLLTSQKLYAFIQLNNPRFKFCSTEREAVAKTLRKAIDF